MFIPPGDTIHESLATSYVLVDALVADLCEGGFSGVVEVVLRNTDSFVVIANGNVSAAIEKPIGTANSGTLGAYSKTTVEQLAMRSREERGRVSIYSYSARTASAVAGRINATPLYVGLSNEFTDLEKMISKLVRERDREWFIEINTKSGPAALLHMRDGQCRVIGSTDHEDSGALDGAGNPALRYLIDECNGAGGTFDVYFTQTMSELFEKPEQPSPKQISESAPIVSATVPEEVVAPRVVGPPEGPSGWVMSSELVDDSSREPESLLLTDADRPSEEYAEQLFMPNSAMAAVATSQSSFEAPAGLAPPGPTGSTSFEAPAELAPIGVPSFEPPAEFAAPGLSEDPGELQPEALSLVWDELPPAPADAEAMAEIKRLIGEVARAIEEAAQAVGRPDSFSLSLRAGQLQIANRFPFLDPFAGEFEYLAGEIVFVGHATAEEFVAGLTEALKLAVEAVSASTAYPDKFRSYVTEDLKKLLAREHAGFERFAIEEVIQHLLSDLR
jgi:hypothetical protein